MSKHSDDFRNLGPPVGPDANYLRLDRYLSAAFPFHSRREWKSLCNAGSVTVNGKPGRRNRRLNCGDQLAHFQPQVVEPPVNDQLYILAEMAGIIAIDKPANLPMHESGLYRHNTFVAILRRDFGAEWFPVHRLDRETSGVVICAATQDLRRRLSEAFVQHHVRKTYRAILSGLPEWEETTVTAALKTASTHDIPHKVAAEDGAAAVTRFRVAERSPAGALVDVFPVSGRGNQIRAHAAWLGHHIVGDKVYHRDREVCAAYKEHGDTALVQAAAGGCRHALHAHGIEFRHPDTQREISVVSPIPDDFRAMWAAQSRY